MAQPLTALENCVAYISVYFIYPALVTFLPVIYFYPSLFNFIPDYIIYVFSVSSFYFLLILHLQEDFLVTYNGPHKSLYTPSEFIIYSKSPRYMK